VEKIQRECAMILDYEVIEQQNGQFDMLIWATEGELPNGHHQLVVPLDDKNEKYIDYVTKVIGARLFMDEFTNGETYQKKKCKT
jgi:hypothetical protein